MNEQLEKLIDFALADGILSDKERGVLYRKANELGVDRDEFEMILEAKLHMVQKATTPPPPPPPQDVVPQKSNKEGDTSKCPSCGAPVQSFMTHCPDCGHEFRNTEAVSSISKLHEELQKIEAEERARPRSWIEQLDGEMAIHRAVANRQKTTISSFPVPNTKEDLLEFLSIASSQAQAKIDFGLYKWADPKNIIKQAWHAKCEQIIVKARFSMRDDQKTLEEFELYAKQLKIK